MASPPATELREFLRFGITTSVEVPAFVVLFEAAGGMGDFNRRVNELMRLRLLRSSVPFRINFEAVEVEPSSDSILIIGGGMSNLVLASEPAKSPVGSTEDSCSEDVLSE